MASAAETLMGGEGGVLRFNTWRAPQADDHFTEQHPQETGFMGWKWQLLSQSQGLTRVICMSHPLHPRSVSLDIQLPQGGGFHWGHSEVSLNLKPWLLPLAMLGSSFQ